MEIKIFYSWQSDLPNNTNRGFIEKALNKAAKSIRNDDSIKVEPVVDRDTQGVLGSPSIPHVILQKIDECDIFVCDVSIINNDSKYRLMPNPNVLFELGYALKRLSWDNIILVMNEAFGGVRELPFDLEKRRTVTYKLPPTQNEKVEVRKILEKQLERQVRLIVEKEDPQIEKVQITEKKNKVDLFLQKAKELEEKNEFQIFREEWANSDKGLKDVSSSMINALRLIDTKYKPHIKTYQALGIELSKKNSCFTLENKEYGCKVELKNLETASSLTSTPRIFLEIALFKKNQYTTLTYIPDPIKTRFLYPDINPRKEVFWIDSVDHLNFFSPQQICNKCFEWLIDQIESPLPTLAEQELIK
jgi:hypothetical protein